MGIGIRAIAFLAALGLAAIAHGAETDQYLVWDVELEDSAAAVNQWLNAELVTFLESVNSSESLRNESADELTIRFMRYVFDVRPFARINDLYNSGVLDEYPPREQVNFFEYQRMSIYRGPAFPFVLFMARTIRIGEIYLGIDKLSHFLGYGRRYFAHYLELERKGLNDEEIVERLVQHGLQTERWFTGRAVNGVISRSDLEANYQGLRFAIDFSRGDSPLLIQRGGVWQQSRPIDIVPYMTPHLDESYYTNIYWAARKRRVLPLVESRYAPLEESSAVRRRFATYERYPASVNVQYVDELLTRASER